MGAINKILTEDSREYLCNFWHSEVIQHKREMQIHGIKLGEALYNIKNKHLYRKMGFDKFSQYCALPEISVKYATAMQLIRVYETFVLKLDVSEEKLMTIDYAKLDIIGVVANKNNISEWLYKAEQMPRYDLKLEVKKNLIMKKEGVSESDVEKEFIDKPSYYDGYQHNCPYWDGYRCEKGCYSHNVIKH